MESIVKKTAANPTEITTIFGIDERLLWIIFAMVFAGLFGGFVSYMRDVRDLAAARSAGLDHENTTSQPSEKFSLPYNLCLSLIAALLVPLFLSIIQSSLIEHLFNKGNDTVDWRATLLIVTGFCLVASLSANTFIGSISAKVLRMAKDAKAGAQDAAKLAAETKAQTDADLSKVLRMARDANAGAQDAAKLAAAAKAQAEANVFDEIDLAELNTTDGEREEVQLSSTEQNILMALLSKPNSRRSISGIISDLQRRNETLNRPDLEGHLENLRSKSLVEFVPLKDARTMRYILSPVGYREAQFALETNTGEA